MKRNDGRSADQIRSLFLTYGVYGNADGSVLFELGKTKVLCSVMMQDGVPAFLRGKGKGWLTAEYTMLPASTQTRTVRDSSSVHKNGRSVEISRLIGRALRSVVNLDGIGERTIYVDCDVIQADGGTRTAAITGAYCALQHAMDGWNKHYKISPNILLDSVGAVSVGWSDDQILLDINFEEDSVIGADFNFVMTGSGKVIELQGATEKEPISWEIIDQMRHVAFHGIKQMLENIALFEPEIQDTHLKVSIKDLQAR